MKKTLLLSAIAFIAICNLNAQQVWNFGSDTQNFPLSTGLAGGTSSGGAGTPIDIPGATKTTLGLTVSAGLAASANTGAITGSSKTFVSNTLGSLSFVDRFQFNGGGYSGAASSQTAPTVFLPIQRYISFQVTGTSDIYAIGIPGSSSDTNPRTVFVTDGTSLIGSLIFPASSTVLTDATVTYTGPATTLYLFCNAAVNFYYLQASNVVVTSVNKVLTEKGVSFNGAEILNTKGLSLEVYNVLGKKVAGSLTSIPTTNFQKGVYIVRAAGLNDSLKICI